MRKSCACHGIETQQFAGPMRSRRFSKCCVCHAICTSDPYCAPAGHWGTSQPAASPQLNRVCCACHTIPSFSISFFAFLAYFTVALSLRDSFASTFRTTQVFQRTYCAVISQLISLRCTEDWPELFCGLAVEDAWHRRMNMSFTKLPILRTWDLKHISC